jgi:phosphoglycolate phosphatase
MSKRLVLFDIDGTLLYGGPVWKKSFEDAFLAQSGRTELPQISFGGKTDPLLCREFLGLRDGEAHCELTVAKIIDDYLLRAEKALPERKSEMQVFTGVRELIAALSKTAGVRVGLLTGNVRRGAELKLRAAELHTHFEFGVYGDDHWNRYELPRIAEERAPDFFGEKFSGKEIVIIGDTIHDVGCGKTIGARTIAVGTGWVDRETLLASKPDFYFENMSDTAAWVRAITDEF